jgi:hypothetical protein
MSRLPGVGPVTPVVALLLLLVLAAPSSSDVTCRESPPEWARARRGDSDAYLYEIGAATGQPNGEQARRAALASAEDAFSRRLTAALGASQATGDLVRLPRMAEVEVMPGADYVCGRSAWLLVRCSRATFDLVLRRMQWPLRLWTSAEESFDRADRSDDTAAKRAYEAAGRDSLRRLLAEYPIGLQAECTSEKAALRLAGRMITRGEPCDAREELEAVLAHSTSDEWKAQAGSRLEDLECTDEDVAKRALTRAFSRGTASLRCCLESGGVLSEYPELYAEIARQLGAAGIEIRQLPCGVPERNTSHGRCDLVLHATFGTEKGLTRIEGSCESHVQREGGARLQESFPVEVDPDFSRAVALFKLAHRIALEWRTMTIQGLGGKP